MDKIKNSKVLVSYSQNLKSSKKELKKRQRMQFFVMTSIVFIILFVILMCITVVVASIRAENETNKNKSTDEGNSIIFTYDNQNTQAPEMKKLVSSQTTEPEEETTNPAEETKNYTDDDLYYLAAAVCHEAGGESEEIQLLVANVIINRVNSSLYPNTIYEVLTQYMQYGTMWKYGISFPDWADQKVKDQCYSVAKRILQGERYCPENVLFQAEFEQGSGIYKYFDEGYYFCYYGN